jgi:hypothetical protein
VSAVAGNTTVTLDWTPPVDQGGAPVVRYRMTNVEFGWSVDTDYEAQHPYTLSGLTNGVAVSFTVAAVNAIGEAGPASAATAQVTPVAPAAPGAPTGLSGAASDSSAVLSWTAPTSIGGAAITGYRVTPYIDDVAQQAITTPTAATSYRVVASRTASPTRSRWRRSTPRALARIRASRAR